MRRAFGLLVLLIALAACSSSGGSGTPDNGSNPFRTALQYVPATATVVEYTDWKALGHPSNPAAALTFTALFDRAATTIKDAVGVNIADADWEIDTGATPESVALSLPHADLVKFTDVLARSGFARKTQGSVTSLTCPSILARCGAVTWAFGNFRIDLGAGVLTESARDRPAVTASDAFATSAKPLLADIGMPDGAWVRLGTRDSCEYTELRNRNPPPPQSFIDRLNAVVGKFSFVQEMAVTADNVAVSHETAYVELAEHSRAASELAGRATVQTQLDSLSGEKSTPVQIKPVRADGVVDVYALTGSGRDLYNATFSDRLGINVCPSS